MQNFTFIVFEEFLFSYIQGHFLQKGEKVCYSGKSRLDLTGVLVNSPVLLEYVYTGGQLDLINMSFNLPTLSELIESLRGALFLSIPFNEKEKKNHVEV